MDVNSREEFLRASRAAAEQFGAEVWDSIVAGPLPADFDEWMLEQGGRLLRELTGRALTARSERLGVSGRCTCCGRPVEFKERLPFTVHTVLAGRDVEVVAQLGRCEPCRTGHFPLLHELGTDPEGFTPALRRLALTAGVLEPYEDADTKVLEFFSHVSVSGKKIRSLVAEAGPRAVLAMQEADRQPEPVADIDEPVNVLVDGGMLRIDKRWQEVKVGCVYRGEDRAQTGKHRHELLSKRYVAVRGDPKQLAALLLPMAIAAGADRRPVVARGDGALWIWNFFDEILPGATQILDWYHASEHVADAAKALYGEGSEEGARWRELQLARLWEDGVNDVVQALRFQIPSLTGGKREAAEGLLTYIEHNRGRMLYKTYREKGYQIGSGAVESSVGHVLQIRMKRSGMRWKQTGADHMIALRAVYRTTCRAGGWAAFTATPPRLSTGTG